MNAAAQWRRGLAGCGRRVLCLLLAPPGGAPFDAFVLLTDPLTFVAGARIVETASAQRIPVACEFRFLARVGCLITYGPTLDEFSQRTARQVDLILKGAKPGDLLFEQVTRFELIVNLKTARAIGVTVPPSILVRADEAIQ